MTRYWICHWQNRYWRDDVNREHASVGSCGSNNFRKRGVRPGDVVYVVSLLDGHLLLGGRMTVGRIVSRQQAVRIKRDSRLYPAREWIIGKRQSGTPLDLHRQLAPALARQLRCVSASSGTKGLCFASRTQLDGQSTRGIRELTRESAALLDRIIDLTDGRPDGTNWITVTPNLLLKRRGRSATNGKYRYPTLVVTIRRDPFAAILSIPRRKPVEYRVMSNYWLRRLEKVGTAPFNLRMLNGMTPPVPEATVRVVKVVKNRREKSLHIHLGRVIEVKHWDRRREAPTP